MCVMFSFVGQASEEAGTVCQRGPDMAKRWAVLHTKPGEEGATGSFSRAEKRSATRKTNRYRI